jgi:hypothetical protein
MTVATNGFIKLLGLKTGNQYCFSVYISDLAGVNWKFTTDSTAVAGSSDNLILPNENTRIVDISLLTTPTVSTASVPYLNDVSTGQPILVGNCLYTTINRSFPSIILGAGKKLTIRQV